MTVVPHTSSSDELARFDGVVLSNGPGDPEPLHARRGRPRRARPRVPISESASATSSSASPPGIAPTSSPSVIAARTTRCSSVRTGRVLVTSQNHGFAVDATEGAEATHVSLYDGTVEGFDFPELRARSVQFHPEAGPGPHDAWPILEGFVQELAECR